MEYKEIYKSWLESEYIDKETKNELLSFQDNMDEIKDRFYKELEFGTGGIRGVIGAGTNRINNYTIEKVTQGLANYIVSLKNYKSEDGVCISYDSRWKSYEFAICSSLVLNANGIKTYVFEKLHPTPVLSFAIREYKCIAGIMITASHNPPEYNGFKVYGQDGAQLVSPEDSNLISFVKEVKSFSSIKKMKQEEAIEKGLLRFIFDEIDLKYDEVVLKKLFNKEVSKNINIVYTPLHGTGGETVKRLFQKAGYDHFNIVEKQEQPDARFQTVHYPNPEDKKAFELALELAHKENADLILANDPDADRVGVFVKHHGEYEYLNGNTIGVLLLNYILEYDQSLNFNKREHVLSTIVSTRMTEKIANDYGVAYEDVLTGFKYIGEKINQFEKAKERFIFGFEESIGYLPGTYARDKDGVFTSVLIAEMVAVYKEQGKTLIDKIKELYEKYGYFLENTKSITFSGFKGQQQMKEIMQKLRNHRISHFAGLAIKEVQDYKSLKAKSLHLKKEYDLTLPMSDVLYFQLENDNWICIRPSGTEPKIKIYFGVKEHTKEKAQCLLDTLQKSFMEIIGEIE